MKKSLFGRAALAGTLAATSAMAFDATTAHAAVVCATTPINVPQNIDGIYINLVTGATGTSAAAVAGWDFNPYASSSGTLLSFNAGTDAGYVSSGGTISALSAGVSIDASRTYLTGVQSTATAMGTYRAGVSSATYLGFRFAESNNTYYGWMDLTTTAPNGFPATLNSYCYDDTGAGIAAGYAGPPDRIFRYGFDPSVVIFANGALDSGPISESGVAAPTGTNWSELQHGAGNTTESNTNYGFADAHGQFRLADDFTVPSGTNWTLSDINVYSYVTGAAATPSPFVGATLEIRSGRPGDPASTRLCGDTTRNALVGSTDAGLFRIGNSAVPSPGLTPGTTRRIWRNRLAIPAGCAGTGFFTAGSTYWISWSTIDSASGLHFAPSNVIPGARSRVTDNARQFNVSTSTWTDVVDAGIPDTAPDMRQDFPFQLIGTAATPGSAASTGMDP